MHCNLSLEKKNYGSAKISTVYFEKNNEDLKKYT